MYGYLLIECCEANSAYTDLLRNLESEYPGLSVLENSCMSECELCAKNPYVFLNGRIIRAENIESLLVSIREQLEADTN